LTDKKNKYIQYLSGKGIEIGALNNPLSLPPNLKIKYVDILSEAEINKHYPGAKIPDIVCDGTYFPEVDNSTFDFVIANHLLEHFDDPVRALKEWHRILKDGGVVFMALPDKRFSFDKERKRTLLSHLIDEHENPLENRLKNLDHLIDWATYVEKLKKFSEKWKSNLIQDTQFIITFGSSMILLN